MGFSMPRIWPQTQSHSWINVLYPWACLLFMGTAWGLSFSLGKIAVDNGVGAFGVSLFQSTLSGSILLIITILRRKPLKELRDYWAFILLIALLGAAIPSVLFYQAAPFVQAGILAITVALIPMMTYSASIPLKIEKFTFRRFSGLIFGIGSILLIALPENSLPDRSAVPWILLVCISSICYAAENIILGFKSAINIGPIRLSMGMNLLAGLILLPITIWSDQFYIIQFPFGPAEYALVGLSIISVFAYTMFVYSVAQFGAVFASQTGYIVTLSGVFWGMYIFGEEHSTWVWAALLAMIIGLALVSPKKEE